MARRRRVGIVVSALMVLSVACGGATHPATAPSTASDVAPAGTTPTDAEDSSMAELKDHHRHHHHGGFAMFIAMSLDTLGVSPEREAAVTKIQQDMFAKLQPAHDAEKKVLSTLADGVAAGRIDRAKVEAAATQVSTASAGVHDAIADLLNQLHAALTLPQRVALVDKVEAHFHVWQEANSDGEPGDQGGHGGQLAKLATELGMSADQVEKARASFKSSMAAASTRYDAGEGETHLKEFGSAFIGDTFDAKTLAGGAAANAHIATWGTTRTVRLYEAVTPVLTVAQRTALADMLRRHANYKRTQQAT